MTSTSFVPEGHHLRELLLFHFHFNNTAAKPQLGLVKAYADHAFSKPKYFRWPDKYERGHFDLENKKLRTPSKTINEVEPVRTSV